MSSPWKEIQHEVTVHYEEHQAAVTIIFPSVIHPDIPASQVCRSVIAPCCDEWPRERCLAFLEGVLHRGRYDVINPATRICQQVPVQEDASIVSDQVRRPRKRARLDHSYGDCGVRGDHTLRTDDRTNDYRDDDETTEGGNDDGTNDEVKVADVALKVVKKLAIAMRKLEKQPFALSKQSPTLQIDLWEKQENIQQLGDSLWAESDRIAKAAGEVVHFLRLLSSCCRNYQKCNNMPVDFNADPAQQEKQRRHDDGFAVLCWIVDGLYSTWGPPALMLYWAVCRTGYHLNAVTRLSRERRKRVAEKVVESLNDVSISVQSYATLFHPGVFLKYRQRGHRLFDICSSLGMVHLATLPIFDPEVEKFMKGVPISLLNDRWPPGPLEAPVQENGWPPKRQTQSEFQPEHPPSMNDSPCADSRPPRNGLDSHIEPRHRHSPAGAGIPTPDSTVSVSNSQCNENAVELPADERLRPPSYLPTVSAIPVDGVESDRVGLIGAAAFESPAPGTTQQRPPPASTDEAGRCPSQSTTINYYRCVEVSTQNIVDDSNPGHISRHDVDHFESRDDQSPSPSSLTTDVPSVSRAVPDTAELSNLGHPIEYAHHQRGTHVTVHISNNEECSAANPPERAEAVNWVSSVSSQQPPNSITGRVIEVNRSQRLRETHPIGAAPTGQASWPMECRGAALFCETGNPDTTLMSPEQVPEGIEQNQEPSCDMPAHMRLQRLRTPSSIIRTSTCTSPVNPRRATAATTVRRFFSYPHSPSPPQALWVSENLLYNIKLYFKTSCRTMIFDDYGIPFTPNGAKLDNSLNDFDSYCFTATMLVGKGLYAEFYHTLSKASALVEQILRAEHPRTLSYFLEVFIHLIQTGLPEVATSLRGYVKKMSERVIRKEHPWGHICRLLGELDSETLEQAMAQIWKCITDVLDSELGTTNRFAVSVRLDYVKRVVTNHLEEETLLRNLLAQFGDIPRLSTPRVMLNLAHNLDKQGHHDEAEEMALEVFSLLQRHEIYSSAIVERIESMKIVSHSQFSQGKILAAEQTMRDAIGMIVGQWGKQHSWVPEFKYVLEGWVRGWGRIEEADTLRREIEELIGEDGSDGV